MKSLCKIIVFCLVSGAWIGEVPAWPLYAVDVSLSRASDPYRVEEPRALGTTAGSGLGMSFDMNLAMPETALFRAAFMARADMQYFRWTYRDGYVSGTLTRLPLFLGVRGYMKYGFFAEGGFALTYDMVTADYTGPLYGIASPGRKTTDSYFDLKFAPGIGLEYPVIGNTIIGIHARYHIRTGAGIDGYSTVDTSIGYRF